MSTQRLLVWVSIGVAFMLGGCTPRFTTSGGAIYQDPHGFFRCTLPANGWAFSSGTDVALALWNKSIRSGIAVNVTPLHDDRELDLLVRHLLIAFERRTLLDRREVVVEGRRAQGVVLDGWVEGENIRAEAYVVKGDGVVYDLVAWSSPDAFPHLQRVFRAFLGDIRFLDAGGSR